MGELPSPKITRTFQRYIRKMACWVGVDSEAPCGGGSRVKERHFAHTKNVLVDKQIIASFIGAPGPGATRR